jgi:hypothetical protein
MASVAFLTATVVGLVLAIAIAVIHAARLARGNRARPLRRSPWDWFVDVLTLLSFSIMAISGFGGMFSTGRIAGWPLLIHSVVAGVFLPALALTAITWAGRFGAGASEPVDVLSRWMFWALLAFGVLAGAAILAAMTPLAGYNVQDKLYSVHRYAALGLTLTVLLQCYVAIVRRFFARV